ncbi:sel1 repeat family protein [Burkholderia catarinensis]|uniref:sel1 repeat family protein n=1 Tax=Burkholderia catarinensis TaxID=1108140 RepID=UPI0010083B5E|nr:sel1 repeat family protein [Burkholderia catarinensis]
MDKHGVDAVLNRVRDLINRDNIDLARKLLAPLVEEKNGEALFIYSMFSNPGESDDDFERRSISLLREASVAGCVSAIYALGNFYLNGDLVERDDFVSSLLFKHAAEHGHSAAKLAHGLNLFYGSNGIEKDELLGVTFVKAADSEGVEGAAEELRELMRPKY